ncbi:hypothetical protein [Cellulomonas sp. KRMCY2]|uniref:hypothetical protein n=1 Tax=Cellulomonas sp. KRMCY2 TaxID=1304865 RepID=UPI000551A9A2|nr:hypothetical protein [Cellulomonas sp. KRMCY2]
MVLPTVIALVVVALLGVAVLVWDRRRTPLPAASAGAANRHAALTAAVGWASLIGGLVVGAIGVMMGNLNLGGRTIALIPCAAGIVFLAVHTAGELTWPRPRGEVRVARLAVRDTGDVAPSWLRAAPWAWASLLTVALVAFGAMAYGPRTIAATVPAGALVGAGRAYEVGPFPGWWYGVPLLIGTAAMLLSTELVLRLITLRPALTDIPADWDMALRRRSARRVLRGGQAPLAMTTSGVLWVAHQAIARGTSPSDLLAGTCLVLAWMAAVGGIVVMALPGRDFRAHRAPGLARAHTEMAA